MGRPSNEELAFNGYRVSVWEDEVLEKDSGDGCTTRKMYLMPLKCILKMVKTGKNG